MAYTMLRILHGPEWLNAIFRVLWVLANISLFWSLNENPRVLELLPSGHKEVHSANSKAPDIMSILSDYQAFLNADLTVYQFALMCGTSVAVTSKAIKQQTGQSFNQLINSYRIKHFIQHLTPESIGNQTIEGLALNSGFKSRASFYRAFKLEMGTTPSDWISDQFKDLNAIGG